MVPVSGQAREERMLIVVVDTAAFAVPLAALLLACVLLARPFWFPGSGRADGITPFSPPTPPDVRFSASGDWTDQALLARRRGLYAAAKAQYPERWSGSIRNREPDTVVLLNPGKPLKQEP